MRPSKSIRESSGHAPGLFMVIRPSKSNTTPSHRFGPEQEVHVIGLRSPNSDGVRL